MHGRAAEAEAAAIAEIESDVAATKGDLPPADGAKELKIRPTEEIGYVALLRVLLRHYPSRSPRRSGPCRTTGTTGPLRTRRRRACGRDRPGDRAGSPDGTPRSTPAGAAARRRRARSCPGRCARSTRTAAPAGRNGYRPRCPASRTHRRAPGWRSCGPHTWQGHKLLQSVRNFPAEPIAQRVAEGDKSLRLGPEIPGRRDHLLKLRLVRGRVAGGGTVPGEQHPGDLVDLPVGGLGGQDRRDQKFERRGEIQLGTRVRVQPG